MSNQEMKNALEETKMELEHSRSRENSLIENLAAIKNSDACQTMQFVSAFADTGNNVQETALDEKTTVFTLTAFGEEYQIANSVEASLIRRAVNIANMEKGATLAKYAALANVERNNAHVSVAKTIGEFAEKVMGIPRGTANDYIATVKTFYQYNEESATYEAISPLWKKANLTNLKQSKGLFNRVGKDRFIQYIMDGELHITGVLPVLKKDLKAIENEVPNTESVPAETVPENESTNIANANHVAENGKGGEVKASEVDTPQDRARFYLAKVREEMLSFVQDETMKETVIDIIGKLLEVTAL